MAERWILYVATDKRSKKQYDRGSRACMEIVQRNGVGDEVDVQDCDVIRRSGASIPKWLTGTPTLYDAREKRAYRGTDAIVQAATLRAAPPPAPQSRPSHEEMQRVQPREDRRDADAGWPSRKTSVNVVPPRPSAPRAPGGGAPEDAGGGELEGEAGGGELEGEAGAFAPLVDASASEYSDGKKITSNDVEKYLQAREAQMQAG